MRDETSPPVIDSATARLHRRWRSNRPTTCSMVSSSTPNTTSPSSRRSTSSSASRAITASAAVASFTVTRTLMPSMPDARNAMVGAPGWPSSSSRRGASCSARADSARPQVRSTRLRMVARCSERSTRSGSTARSTMSAISCGTPGTAYTTLPPTGQRRPGAVPRVWAMNVAPAGLSA